MDVPECARDKNTFLDVPCNRCATTPDVPLRKRNALYTLYNFSLHYKHFTPIGDITAHYDVIVISTPTDVTITVWNIRSLYILNMECLYA